MRRLTYAPALAFALACVDGTPVAPVHDLAGPVLEARANAVPAGMVPFKYSGWGYTLTSSLGCEGDPTNLAFTAAGVFYASHLGRSAASWTNCFTSAFAFVSQSGTIQAANGDKLFWYGSTATGSSMAIDFVNLTYSATNFSFVGGTGRFEGAFGTYDYSGEFSADLSYVTGSGSGVMSAVGSTNH